MPKLYSISDFATLSRSSRVSLLYYDKVGLLKPASRGANKYRYYSLNQVGVMNVIHVMQELGLSIEEIKQLKDRRTPERTRDIFAEQIGQIDAQIEKWVRARRLLEVSKSIIETGLATNEKLMEIRYMPAEPIIQGKLNDYSWGRNDYDALKDFYNDIRKRYPHLDTNYPVWGIFSGERVQKNDFVWPDRYYMYHPNGYDRKSEGYYAIGYTRGGYGECGELYERLIAYIDDSDYEISGSAYEEYLLNEICIENETDYLIRVMIEVCNKPKSRRRLRTEP